MRKIVGVLIALIASLAVVQSANAEITSVFNGKLPCVTTPSGVRECSGPGGSPSDAPASNKADERTVESWDGTPIDINVAFPDADKFGDGPYPMAMYFHGFGGGKEGFGGDLKRFTDMGMAAFSMTERGFKFSCGEANAITALETAGKNCDNGFIHLMDTRYEVRDAQYFAGVLADEGLVQPTKIASVGASYGGGKSMALASLRNRIMLPDGKLADWKSPNGKAMEIAVAAPIVPWTDFAYALVPNGTVLDYTVHGPYGTKFGVMKAAIINALFGAGDNFSGDHGKPVNPMWDIRGWRNMMAAGESYDTPTAHLMLEEMTTHHSSYYIDDSIPPAPLIIAEGFTDDLFPVDEALRYYNKTKTKHPDSTVGLLFADIGHPRAPLGGDSAQGREVDKEMGFQIVEEWFSHYLLGQGSKPVAGMKIKTQVCPYEVPSGGPYDAASWAALAPGEIRLSDPTARVIETTGGLTSVASKFTTLFDGCTQVPETKEPGVVEYDFPVTPSGGFTLAGSPTVIADMSVENGAESQVAARLFEIKQGQERIIARGVYRPDKSGRQVFQLHGNGYRFEPGTRARLQLLPRDGGTSESGKMFSYVRPSNDQRDVKISNVEVRLPVMEAPGALNGLVKKPLKKALPAGSKLMKDFASIGSVALDGAPTSAAKATVKGKQLKVKLSCKTVNLCRTAKVTIKGAKKKGPIKTAVVAKGSKVNVASNGAKVFTFKLTAKARKLFKDSKKRVRKRGKVRVKKVKGAKKLAAKITVTAAGTSKSRSLTIKRVGRVK